MRRFLIVAMMVILVVSNGMFLAGEKEKKKVTPKVVKAEERRDKEHDKILERVFKQIQKLKEEAKEEMVKSNAKYRKVMETELQKETKKGNFDEAMAIKEKMEELDKSTVTLKEPEKKKLSIKDIFLSHEWKVEGVSVKALPDGTIKKSKGVDGEWKVVGKVLSVKWVNNWYTATSVTQESITLSNHGGGFTLQVK